MLKKALIGIFMYSASTALFAIEDKTEDFKNFFTSRFIGQPSSSSDTWDMTTCIQPNPFGGCIEKGGYKIIGTARGHISTLESTSGRGVLLEQDCDPWTGACSPYFRMDQSFKFTYESVTQGKKQCFPGNFFCNYEWQELHPRGNIYIDIAANKTTGFNITIRYEVLPGHDDRPNRLVATAMRSLKGKAKEIVETYTRQYGTAQTIVIND
jgi:hypothetical protein